MKEYQCKRCGSWAVNPHLHGRLPDVDLDLCDVCYWRKRAENSIPVASAGERRKLKHAIKKDREDLKYLLKVLDNLRQFKLPVPQGLDPTSYATPTYEGDLEIAQRIADIRKKRE